MAVAAIIVNQNQPLMLCIVPSIEEHMSSLCPEKVWWGLTKNCLACELYNLWKLPKMVMYNLSMGVHLHYGLQSLVGHGKELFCLWALQPLEAL
jgi:hypothetical protein